jgi:hypothetical protein
MPLAVFFFYFRVGLNPSECAGSEPQSPHPFCVVQVPSECVGPVQYTITSTYNSTTSECSFLFLFSGWPEPQ